MHPAGVGSVGTAGGGGSMIPLLARDVRQLATPLPGPLIDAGSDVAVFRFVVDFTKVVPAAVYLGVLAAGSVTLTVGFVLSSFTVCVPVPVFPRRSVAVVSNR